MYCIVSLILQQKLIHCRFLFIEIVFRGTFQKIFLKSWVEFLMLMVYIFNTDFQNRRHRTLQLLLYHRKNIFWYIVRVAQYEIHMNLAAASLFDIQYPTDCYQSIQILLKIINIKIIENRKTILIVKRSEKIWFFTLSSNRKFRCPQIQTLT